MIDESLATLASSFTVKPTPSCQVFGTKMEGDAENAHEPMGGFWR